MAKRKAVRRKAAARRPRKPPPRQAKPTPKKRPAARKAPPKRPVKRPRKVSRPAPRPAPRPKPAPKPAPLPAELTKRAAKALRNRVLLRDAVTLLRQHVKGYEASDGYGVRNVEKLDAKTRRRILKRAATIKELTNVPHDIVKARTKKARRSLHRFTLQRIRGAKHFIVHKPADNFKINMRNGNVELEGRFKGAVITKSQFFLFPRKPKRPKELVSMARALLKDMPPGFYTVQTAAHGDTGEPFERDQLLARLNEYLAAYTVDSHGRPTGFDQALVGFRFMSTTLHGAETQREAIDKRREKQREHNKKVRVQAIRKEVKRTKKRRKPRKGK